MSAQVKKETKEIKVSYVVRFEEMVETRKATIENCEKVLEQQEYLINVLREHDANSEEKHFEALIEQIDNQVLELRSYILSLKEKNIKTENLITVLKSNKNYDAVATLVLDEVEVFANHTPEAPRE